MLAVLVLRCSLDVQSGASGSGVGDASDDEFNIGIGGVLVPHGFVALVVESEHLETIWVGLNLGVPSGDCASGDGNH